MERTRTRIEEELDVVEHAIEALQALTTAGVLTNENDPQRQMRAEVEGEEHGWMAGPFLIDQLEELAADLEQERDEWSVDEGKVRYREGRA